MAAVVLFAAATLAAQSAAQPQAQYEIAISQVAAEPAEPIAGQPTVLTVTIRSRSLTPVSRPSESVNLRIVFLRTQPGAPSAAPGAPSAAPGAPSAAPGAPSAAPELLLGEQLGTVRISEPVTMSVSWLAEAGSHVLLARVEILPGRIEPGDVAISAPSAAGLAVTVAGNDPVRPAAAAPGIVARPTGAADPSRTIREPSQGDDPASRDRRITTAPLGVVGAHDAARPAGSGLVIDVPVYVANLGTVRAVELRCSVFAVSLGDLIGTGQVSRPVSGGSFAEMMSVPITPRPGRARSRAVRYRCIAAYIAGDQPEEQRAQMPGGAAAAADRRASTERQLGRPIVVFSDLVEGDIDSR